MKRALLSVDMEGISGITGWPHCTPHTDPWRRHGCPLMNAEARAAVEALTTVFERVTVVDAHWESNNLTADTFDGLPVDLAQGDLFDLSMVPDIADHDALVLLGTHAMVGTADGMMCHTITGLIEAVWMDGRRVGEIGLNVLAAAGCGVPTLAIAGDAAACREASFLVHPSTALISTKGLVQGRNGLELMMRPPFEAIEDVAFHLARAAYGFSQGNAPELLDVASPTETVLRLSNADVATIFIREGWERSQHIPNAVRTVTDDPMSGYRRILDTLAVVFATVSDPEPEVADTATVE